MPLPENAPEAVLKMPLSPRRVWAIAAAVFLIATTVFGFCLYRYQWHGGVAEVVTKVLPYPAAIVNGKVIRYADFQDHLQALERFYRDQQATAVSGSVFPDEAELKRRVLDQLIKDRLAESLAARYGIVVTSEDADRAYDATILDQSALAAPTGKAKAEARASDTLRRMYDLRPSQFKTGILHDFLVRQQLERAVQSDEALNAENRKKAEAALAELRAGKSFKDVAASYSEDRAIAPSGGDRGLIGRGLLPPEVETAAFALKPGETSGVIKSAFGYHVLRVVDRQEANGQVAKVHLLEILVRPIQLDDYLESQKKSASIIVFVR